ncbi:RNAligase [Hordeum vulgare]|nr:RNAligase [Hordeum vulgare]
MQCRYVMVVKMKMCSPYKDKFFFRLRLSIQDLSSCMPVTVVEHIPRTALEICGFRNYTAVGVFVLDRMFCQAWGKEAPKKQAEFNDVLEKNRINISMELVTAVLGDHGQRPKDDYGSKDHVMVQGEILEGLVARIVSRESLVQMEHVLENFSHPPLDGVDSDLGPSLREICAANRSDENQQIKALVENIGSSMCPDHSDWFGNSSGLDAQSRDADESAVTWFLQAHPTDNATKKLQEMIRVIKQRNFLVAFKCYQKVDSLSNDNLYYKMVIQVLSDSVFTSYRQEMRFDVNLFKANNKKAAEHSKDSSTLVKNICYGAEDSNLMVKLKFLPYKIRTFLIRKGLSILFKDGPSDYRNDSCIQISENWGTSASKQKQLCKLLDEWAAYITSKCGNKPVWSSTYLSEAEEPFLEQYAKANQAFTGAAGDLVQPSSPLDDVSKAEGLIVFFPGIPGCAKSALCKELLKMPGGLGNNRPLHSLMGDLFTKKVKYWQKVADARKKEPLTVTLADKNAPNEQIEDLCGTTKSAAVPIVPDSEGTDTNPFSLEALAVFMLRVLQRVNHEGNLDKASPNAGNVLLMFYNLYDGKNRREFEGQLYERFGSLVKMPLLKSDRAPLPGDVKSILDEGLSLFRLHRSRHGRRVEPSEWAQWEKRLREILFENADYLKSIQVPFEAAVKEVVEQLKAVAKGDIKPKRRFGNIVFAAVTLCPADVLGLVRKVTSVCSSWSPN